MAVAVSLEGVMKSRNKTSDYIQGVAKKSTPANTYSTVNTLAAAQKMISGIRDYSTLFGYENIGTIETLMDDIDRGAKNKPKNKMYSENGMTGILNIGMENGKEKKAQEDSILILSHPENKDFKIAMVADGVGGHGNGDAASYIATALTAEWFSRLPKSLYSQDYVKRIYRNGKTVRLSFEDLIKEHLVNVNNKIVEQLGNEPGTTFSAAITRKKDGKDKVTSVSIGDSKVLRISRDGKVTQLSKDDNLISEGIANGEIYVDESEPGVVYTSDSRFRSSKVEYKPIKSDRGIHRLSQGDERFYKYNNAITGFLGCGQSQGTLSKKLNQNSEEYITEWDFRQGDKILLCSDGIADNLSNSEIGSLVYTFRNSDECLRYMVNIIYDDIECKKQKDGNNNPPRYLTNNDEFKSTLKGARDNISGIIVEKEGR